MNACMRSRIACGGTAGPAVPGGRRTRADPARCDGCRFDPRRRLVAPAACWPALGAEVAGHPTMGLEYDAGAASLAAAKAGRPVALRFGQRKCLSTMRALGAYVSLDVLCHGGVDPDRALREAHRCLKPGAIALFNLPAYDWLFVGARQARAQCPPLHPWPGARAAVGRPRLFVS